MKISYILGLGTTSIIDLPKNRSGRVCGRGRSPRPPTLSTVSVAATNLTMGKVHGSLARAGKVSAALSLRLVRRDRTRWLFATAEGRRRKTDALFLVFDVPKKIGARPDAQGREAGEDKEAARTRRAAPQVQPPVCERRRGRAGEEARAEL